MNISSSVRRTCLAAVLALALTVMPGCGGGEGGSAGSGQGASSTGLTPEQLTKGIGPVTTVELGEIQSALVDQGKTIFDMKCAACHRFDERYVGPALGDVLTRRTPEYVMNMMLNPAEMIEKHPEARALLAQFLTPMPAQNLTTEEARAVLEYLRTMTSTN
jgi:mono/diheme cytochrome c family protein